MSKEAPPPYEEQKSYPHHRHQYPQYNAQQPPPYIGQQPPPPAPTQQTVFVTHRTVPVIFGPSPVSVTCPFCHKTRTTTVQVEANSKTHLMALLLCALGCWPCFWIPYTSDGCQSKKHFCGKCNAYLGVYSD